MRTRPLLLITGTILSCLFGWPSPTLADDPDPTLSPATTESSSYSSNPEWEFDSSLTYAAGDFGTATDTDYWYLPLTATRLFKKGELGLTLPFAYVDAGMGIAGRQGQPFQVDPSTAGSARDDAGLGDILLTGRSYFFDEYTQDFNLTGMAQVKFPSADEDKGLGTGEFDETLGLEASKSLNDLWTLYGDIYYTFIGDPPGVDLDNEFAYGLGTGYNLNEKTETTVYYQERTALVDGRDNPRSIFLGLEHALQENTSVYGSIGFGVSDGSPDTLFTTGFTVYY